VVRTEFLVNQQGTRSARMQTGAGEDEYEEGVLREGGRKKPRLNQSRSKMSPPEGKTWGEGLHLKT